MDQQVSVEDFEREAKVAFGEPVGGFTYESSYVSPVYPLAEARIWNGFYHDLVAIRRCVAGFAVYFSGRAGKTVLDYVGKTEPTDEQIGAFFECLGERS